MDLVLRKVQTICGDGVAMCMKMFTNSTRTGTDTNNRDYLLTISTFEMVLACLLACVRVCSRNSVSESVSKCEYMLNSIMGIQFSWLSTLFLWLFLLYCDPLKWRARPIARSLARSRCNPHNFQGILRNWQCKYYGFHTVNLLMVTYNTLFT